MKNVRKIMVPTDFSKPAVQAIKFAAILCRITKAELHVIHFVPVDNVYVYGGVPPIERHEFEHGLSVLAEKQLDQHLKASKLKFFHTSHVLPVYGSVPDAICTEAKHLNIDLIVMPTHGRSGFKKMLMGSVTERVLRTSSVPVLAIPAGRGLKNKAPRNILVPLDFSPISIKAAQYALSWANLLNAKVQLVHIPDVMCLRRYGKLAYSQSMTVAGQRLMDRWIGRLKSPRVQGKVVASDREVPSVAILAEAKRSKVDLIVMSTHGRTGLDRFTLGSEAEKVLRGSSIPVITLR